jgi:NADPH:quinone reductase-like Zn-dependent oxidoreductase
MKAVIQDRYGDVDMLQLRDVAKPTPKPHEVLVRIRAAALHVGDLFMMRGVPVLVRFETGLRRPTRGTPGLDLAGIIEAVGAEVADLRTGDEVFGECRGACAEYAVTPATKLAKKPAAISFEEAAGLVTSGVAALRALRDAIQVQKGHKLLIIGASGGVGTFAVQLAKYYGAEVTAVCSTANLDLVRTLGADHTVDYTREDFAQRPERYDAILDNIENRTLADCRRTLTPGGTLVLNSGTGASGFEMYRRLLAPVVVSPFVRHNLKRYLAIPNRADLTELAKLTESRAIKTVIGKTYALRDTPAALAHIAQGHARGKVIVTI